MEPVPETVEALETLDSLARAGLVSQLSTMGLEVRAVVPQCVGLSLTVVAERLTFTLVSASHRTAGREVVSALDRGDDGVRPTVDLFDEREWQRSAVGSASPGIRSSLSLPVIREGRTVAGVTVYASADDAFRGRHTQVADAVGAWAPGAVENADLSFASRQEALAAPERLRTRVLSARAVSALAAHRGVSVGRADDLLSDAARQAGITRAQLERVMLAVLEP